jgi:hypothetical protein
MYSQHDRWASKVTYLARVLTACHFSVGFFVAGGCVIIGVCAGYFYFSCVLCGGVVAVSVGSMIVIFCTTYFSPIFRPIGMLNATCLARISSYVS